MFANLERDLDLCGEIFPGKPINLIYRLTDYSPPGPVPMELLRQHWKEILRLLESQRIWGYSILGGFFIDHYPEQAAWVRDFIAANSLTSGWADRG